MFVWGDIDTESDACAACVNAAGVRRENQMQVNSAWTLLVMSTCFALVSCT